MKTARPHLPRVLALLTATALWPVTDALAAKPSKAEIKEAKREGIALMPTDKPAKREDKAAARNERDAAGAADARQLTRLRERLEVADDAEWTVIAERINRVEELRRNQITGGRALATGTDKTARPARAAGSGSAELEALKNAVRDQYPDAEIKARLARAHEAQQQRATQLSQAQEELRAVLSVRQEAILVMAGVLPP